MRSQRHQEKDEFYKDREGFREGLSATDQHNSHVGVLKDYSLKHQVSVEYDMNEDSIRDRMLILRVDDYSVVIDYEEFLRIGRFV